MEEVIAFTEGFGPTEIERFVEALGTDRTFGVAEARDAAARIGLTADGSLAAWERRQELGKALAAARLDLEDPVRSGILDDLALRAEGYVGSDIEALAREAGMLALRAQASVITKEHFDEALAKVHPTMNENIRTYYGKIQQHFKGGLPKEVQPPEYQ